MYQSKITQIDYFLDTSLSLSVQSVFPSSYPSIVSSLLYLTDHFLCVVTGFCMPHITVLIQHSTVFARINRWLTRRVPICNEKYLILPFFKLFSTHQNLGFIQIKNNNR